MPRTTTAERKLPRLFQQAGLAAGTSIELDRAKAHYLLDVMRKRADDQVRLFNGEDGEWLASITETARRSCRLRVDEQLRAQEDEPGPTLLFAPIKKSRLDMLMEKATELGVGALLPITTRRTIVDKVNADRLRAITIEAAEQCERLTLPEIRALQSLDQAIADWPEDRQLFVADETGCGQPLIEALTSSPERSPAFLIGPEGGFAPEELLQIGAHPAVIKVDLGPRILRAETAALMALSCAVGAGATDTE